LLCHRTSAAAATTPLFRFLGFTGEEDNLGSAAGFLPGLGGSLLLPGLLGSGISRGGSDFLPLLLGLLFSPLPGLFGSRVGLLGSLVDFGGTEDDFVFLLLLLEVLTLLLLSLTLGSRFRLEDSDFLAISFLIWKFNQWLRDLKERTK
jgi:hypothetical protein